MEEKSTQNLERTDYDIESIGNYDRRFEAGCKDAVFFHVLGIAAVVIATIWMYCLGTCEPSEMQYLFGMPLWFSGAVIIYLIMFVIGMIYLNRWEEFPFTAREDKKGKKEKKA